MDLREIGWRVVDEIDVAQEGSCEHGNEPSGSIKCWEKVAAQLVASKKGLSSMKLV
jgi:hypothetical protein